MSRLEITHNTFRDCFRTGRLWLIQFFANPILLALFVAWLLIPVASNLHLVFNFVFAFVLFAATLALHAGTLNFFGDRQRNENAHLWPAFRRALRHLIPVVICVAVFCLLGLLVAKFEAYQSSFPAYVRSTLPVSLRRHITLPALDTSFSAVLFIARWILVPALLLPLLAQAADRGFRGFDPQGLSAWRKTMFSLGYWLVLLFAALLGVFATQKLVAWTPDFKTSTIRLEAVSLGVRLFFAYLFGLSSWMLTCSVVGRCAAAAGTSSDVTGNPAA
jgi:hypothetical protein